MSTNNDRGCRLVCVLLGIWASGCAQGYEADPARGEVPLQLPAAPIANDPAAQLDAGAAPPPYTGEACTRGDEAPCVCDATGTQGVKTCRFDEASPTQGTFSECSRCGESQQPPSAGDVSEPDAGPPQPANDCSDGMQNGDETDVDCGGSVCPSCLVGKGCESDTDCSAGECVSGTCELPEGSGGPTGGGLSGGGSCMPACTQSCFPIGVLACCNPLGRCGCTWAPGAYCL